MSKIKQQMSISILVALFCMCTSASSSALPARCIDKDYWDGLSPVEKNKVLNAPITNQDAIAFYNHAWKPSDDQRTLDLLHVLTIFQGAGDTEKFYFHVFNEMLLASDGVG